MSNILSCLGNSKVVYLCRFVSSHQLGFGRVQRCDKLFWTVSIVLHTCHRRKLNIQCIGQVEGREAVYSVCIKNECRITRRAIFLINADQWQSAASLARGGQSHRRCSHSCDRGSRNGQGVKGSRGQGLFLVSVKQSRTICSQTVKVPFVVRSSGQATKW